MGVNRVKGAINNLKTVHFLTEVSYGDVPGYSIIHKFAYNPQINLNVTEEIWDGGSTYVYFTTAEPMEIVSTDAADNSTGVGARTVKVFYLNSGYVETNETLTMNGTTPVPLAGTGRRTFRAHVVTAGNSGGNVGNITVQGSGGGDVQAFISAITSRAANQTLMSQYTIPASKTGGLVVLHFSTGKNKDIDYQFQTRAQGEVFRSRHTQDMYQNNAEIFMPLLLPSKTDIRVLGLSDAANTPATCDYVILMKDKV